jgi:hypothetical protein
MIMAFRAIDGLGRRGVSEPHRQVPVPNTPSGSSALITFTARADESKERSNRMQWLHRHRRKSSPT